MHTIIREIARSTHRVCWGAFAGLPACRLQAGKPASRPKQRPPPHLPLPPSGNGEMHTIIREIARSTHRVCWGAFAGLPACRLQAGKPASRPKQRPPPHLPLPPSGNGEMHTIIREIARSTHRVCWGAFAGLPACRLQAGKPASRPKQRPPPHLPLPPSGNGEMHTIIREIARSTHRVCWGAFAGLPACRLQAGKPANAPQQTRCVDLAISRIMVCISPFPDGGRGRCGGGLCLGREAGLPACSLQAGKPANAPQQTRCVDLAISRIMVCISPFPDGGRGRCGGGLCLGREAGLPACSLQAGKPANAPQQTRCVDLAISRIMVCISPFPDGGRGRCGGGLCLGREAGLPACSLQAGKPANAPQQTRCVDLAISRIMVCISPFPDGGRGRCGGGLCLGREAGLPACSLQAGKPANAPQQTRCVDLAISRIMVCISPFPDGGRGRCGGGLCLGREAGLPACSLQAGKPANAPQQTRCVDLAISRIMVCISPFPDGGRGRCGGGLCLGREAGLPACSLQAGKPANAPQQTRCVDLAISRIMVCISPFPDGGRGRCGGGLCLGREAGLPACSLQAGKPANAPQQTRCVDLAISRIMVCISPFPDGGRGRCGGGLCLGREAGLPACSLQAGKPANAPQQTRCVDLAISRIMVCISPFPDGGRGRCGGGLCLGREAGLPACSLQAGKPANAPQQTRCVDLAISRIMVCISPFPDGGRGRCGGGLCLGREAGLPACSLQAGKPANAPQQTRCVDLAISRIMVCISPFPDGWKGRCGGGLCLGREAGLPACSLQAGKPANAPQQTRCVDLAISRIMVCISPFPDGGRGRCGGGLCLGREAGLPACSLQAGKPANAPQQTRCVDLAISRIMVCISPFPDGGRGRCGGGLCLGREAGLPACSLQAGKPANAPQQTRCVDLAISRIMVCISPFPDGGRGRCGGGLCLGREAGLPACSLQAGKPANAPQQTRCVDLAISRIMVCISPFPDGGRGRCGGGLCLGREAGLPACSLQAGKPANAPQQTRCVDLAISRIMVCISPFPDGGRGRCGGGLCLGREAGLPACSLQAGKPANAPQQTRCVDLAISRIMVCISPFPDGGRGRCGGGLCLGREAGLPACSLQAGKPANAPQQTRCVDLAISRIMVCISPFPDGGRGRCGGGLCLGREAGLPACSLQAGKPANAPQQTRCVDLAISRIMVCISPFPDGGRGRCGGGLCLGREAGLPACSLQAGKPANAPQQTRCVDLAISRIMVCISPFPDGGRGRCGGGLCLGREAGLPACSPTSR